ncbi:MAG: aminoglycoside phosphotransferase family protein [Rhodanobacter sp.]
MPRATLDEEMTAVSGICKGLGLGEIMLAILKAAHHTTFLVSPLNIVARIQSSEPSDAARETATREVAVARHLAGRSAPALAPLADIAGPHIVASCVVTLWPYVEHGRAAEEDDAAAAATTLDSVHRALLDYRGDLPPCTEALAPCWSVLVDNETCPGLGRLDRELLKTHYRRLRRAAEGPASHRVPLRGDPHLGNLLIGENGPLWLDFEDACLGPREYDIACLPHTTWSHFADTNHALVRNYADLRSICIAVWCCDDLARSDGARKAAQHHLDRVREFPL